jgi:hypothetical protein
MRALKVGGGSGQQTYICIHWKTFPPPGAGGDAENLRANAAIDPGQYNRLQLWEQLCGLFRMEEGKCLTCPHHRKIIWKTRGPYLLAPDGTESPVVDSAQGEASPRNRHMAGIFRRPGTAGSHQSAAWMDKDTPNDQGGDE